MLQSRKLRRICVLFLYVVWIAIYIYDEFCRSCVHNNSLSHASPVCYKLQISDVDNYYLQVLGFSLSMCLYGFLSSNLVTLVMSYTYQHLAKRNHTPDARIMLLKCGTMFVMEFCYWNNFFIISTMLRNVISI